MILGAVLKLVAGVLGSVSDLLPVGSALLDSSVNVGELAGEYVGPLDAILPVGPLVSILESGLGILLPTVMTYQVVEWTFRHLPVVGNG